MRPVYAGGSIEMLFAQNRAPARPIFDHIVLAAGDEQAGSFTQPYGGGWIIFGEWATP